MRWRLRALFQLDNVAPALIVIIALVVSFEPRVLGIEISDRQITLTLFAPRRQRGDRTLRSLAPDRWASQSDRAPPGRGYRPEQDPPNPGDLPANRNVDRRC